MPIISFSEKRDELVQHIKTETTRLWTQHRWNELNEAMVNNKRLYIWWKSRTKQGEKLFEAHVHSVAVVGFVRLNTGRGPWPWWGEFEVQDGTTPVFWPKLRMTEVEVAEYVRNEGMKDLDEFMSVLAKKNNVRVRYDGSIIGVPLIRIKFWPDEGTPHCRMCGCTEHNACVTDGTPCSWARPGLCSACAEVA